MIQRAHTPTLFPYTTLFRSDFALVDDALLVLVNELDRILDRDHVALHLPVDSVEHRGKRRRFSGARGAGDQNQDRKSTRLNSSHMSISYAVFCLKNKTNKYI